MNGPPSFLGRDRELPWGSGRARRARILAPTGKWVSVEPLASADLNIEGAGVVRRLSCVFNADGRPAEAMRVLRRHPHFYRNIWVHIAFDDTGEVHVSAPLADFFLFPHGDLEDVDSELFQSVRVPPLAESPYQGALTCFAPMPFAECAKISFVNRNPIPVRLIASVDWMEVENAEPPFHFRATFARRRAGGAPMLFLDESDVEGSFVGLGLWVDNRDHRYRWHERPEVFAVDGEAEPLLGTGAEDYFCLAWGFRRLISRPLFGVTCARPRGESLSLPSGRFDPAGEFSMYRFHAHDRIDFRRSIRMSLGEKSIAVDGRPLEFRSVAYWYGRRTS